MMLVKYEEGSLPTRLSYVQVHETLSLLICALGLSFGTFFRHRSNLFRRRLSFSFKFAAYKPTWSINPQRATIVVGDVGFWNIIVSYLYIAFPNYNEFISYCFDISNVPVISGSYMLIDYLFPRNIKCVTRRFRLQCNSRFFCHKWYAMRKLWIDGFHFSSLFLVFLSFEF